MTTTGNGSAAQPQKPAMPAPTIKLSVSKGRRTRPVFLFVYGVDGVGKSTFAANAPKPLFIDVEGSTDEMDVERIPEPEDRPSFKWTNLLGTVRAMVGGALPDYKTLVIDTVDAAEALLFAHICAEQGAPTIGDVPYGRGYDIALDAWRELVAALEQLQTKRGMHVVLLGHSQLKTFKNPMGDDFDRYIVKMHEKAAAFLRERAFGVYFANYETFADKDKKTKRVRGISTGARLLYTQRTGAYDAKDRYSLPEQIPLDWSDFEKARQNSHVATEALKAEIERKAKELGGEFEKFAREYLEKNSTNAVQLNLLNTKLNAKLAEKAEQAAPAPAVEPATTT